MVKHSNYLKMDPSFKCHESSCLECIHKQSFTQTENIFQIFQINELTDWFEGRPKLLNILIYMSLLLKANILNIPSDNSANNPDHLLLGGYEIHYDGPNLK